jgi:hypothetical protein
MLTVIARLSFFAKRITWPVYAVPSTLNGRGVVSTKNVASEPRPLTDCALAAFDVRFVVPARCLLRAFPSGRAIVDYDDSFSVQMG